MRATVPILLRSLGSGSSTATSFCASTPITLVFWYAFLTSLIDLSLPIVIGITTPGNRTVLRNGRIPTICGISSVFMVSSSSGDNNGMNSESSSNKFEKLKISSNGSFIDLGVWGKAKLLVVPELSTNVPKFQIRCISAKWSVSVTLCHVEHS